LAEKIGTLVVGVHGSKDSVWDSLNEFGEDNEFFTKEFYEKLINNDIYYIGYEILIHVDVFDDGTFKIAKMNDGVKDYLPV
jgi:hypothetical protein